MDDGIQRGEIRSHTGTDDRTLCREDETSSDSNSGGELGTVATTVDGNSGATLRS